jgi:hypothetical protein
VSVSASSHHPRETPSTAHTNVRFARADEGPDCAANPRFVQLVARRRAHGVIISLIVHQSLRALRAPESLGQPPTRGPALRARLRRGTCELEHGQRVRRTNYLALLSALLIALLTLADVGRAHAQQGTAALVGTVTDSATGARVADALVTVTSPNLQGEEIAVTDAAGVYRIPGLPPGDYLLRVERATFRPYAREALELHADTTIRLNASLLPEALRSAEVVVVGQTPTVDVGSSATGLNVTSEFTSRIPLIPPGAKGAAARSFESVADVVPGAQSDAFGISMFGTTSPENRYLLDGLSISNPAFGVLSTPLSIEFMKEVSVISGGYMPEYGRSTGGILNAITKSGSNEFHGSVFSNWSPGALEGSRRRVLRQGETIVTEPKLLYMGDLGGDVGGPIVRDRLWFYAGFDWAESKYTLGRSLHRIVLDEQGAPVPGPAGGNLTENIPGTEQTFVAQQDIFQGIGKLTWAPNTSNRVMLSVNGVYPVSGGNGKYGISPLTGQPEIGTESTVHATPLNGTFSALAHRFRGSSTNVLARWSSDLDEKRARLDTTLGYHHATGGRLPSDGSPIGGGGLASLSNVWWLRNDPAHSITDFELVPNGACDAPESDPSFVRCPVLDYHTGGPEDIDEQTMHRVQGRSMFTYLFEALGHHVFKVGVDLEFVRYDHLRAYSGARDFVESTDGSYFEDGRVYGYLTGPDQPVVLESMSNQSRSASIGGFIQDSWSIAERVTLNLGLRYDAQLLYAGDGSLAMALPNQWSPRAGIVYDPLGDGRAKLYTNYGRYYETVPLLMLDRYLTGEPLLFALRDPAGCNPLVASQQTDECLRPEVLLVSGEPPNTYYAVAGAGRTPIDPKLKPPSSDEFVLGGDYEIVRDGRIGVSYTKRWLNHTIEDMSRDEGRSFFFGNPGYGIAREFPRAERRYDAVTLQFTKMFSRAWLMQASYTASWLRGNYGGLFRAEDGQLDPHQNSDFDLLSLYKNRSGPLPGDRRHQIKSFIAREIGLGGAGFLTPGLAFRAFSGEPSNYLGAHPLYQVDQVYILPRGAGERLPWTYSADLRLAYGFRFSSTRGLAATVDIFNLFNFQRETVRDQRYTSSEVSAVDSGGIGALTNADGTPFDPSTVNPNFGRATAYQAPRVFRFGLKGTF